MNWDAVSFIAKSETEGKSLGRLMLEREMEISQKSEAEIKERMAYYWEVMQAAATSAIEHPLPSMGGLLGGEARKLHLADGAPNNLLGPLVRHAITYAMSVMEVNASMGLIVATPTAGSSGILPGVFLSLKEQFHFSDEDMLDALFCAGAIGYLINQAATISGAEGGCQAEVGSAAAMAAAATVQLLGGTTRQSMDAASIALMNLLGLVCDPVRGLVELPCQLRNAQGAATALSAAELVMAGLVSAVPFDDMVQVLYRVGISLPVELRETALGGTATAAVFQTAAAREGMGCTSCEACGGCG